MNENEFQSMQEKYAMLVKRYLEFEGKLQKTVEGEVSKNEMLGKNIMFQNNVLGYVTKQGVFRKYPNRDVFDVISGNYGCPKEIINVNIPWTNEYIDGSMIPLNPPLLVGRDMKEGESCGFEGSNVYVSSLNLQPSSKYVGCYTNNNLFSPNPEDNGYSTFESCQSYAANNQYSYFGLGEMKEDGTAKCFVSNSLSESSNNNNQKISPSLLWSSNTSGSGASLCFVSNDGRLLLKNIVGDIIWQSSAPLKQCEGGGGINKNTLTATYGGKCKKAKSGNATNKIKDLIDSEIPQNVVSISNQTFGDPAPGCKKGWDTAYQCGNAWKTSHIDYAEGQNFIFDCSQEMQQCMFSLVLQSDGNMCLLQNDKETIWCSSTTNKQQTKNPEWVAKKGKLGKSFLKTNESLSPEEWIGSEDGSLRLILEKNGNLALYTSIYTEGCPKRKNDRRYGSSSESQAVYEITEQGDKSLLGKIGYVSDQSQIKEYPETMIEYTNKYEKYMNSDSPNNNLETLIFPDVGECETACNNKSDCGGYVFQPQSQTCWLKSKQIYPKAEKTYNKNTILGVRIPSIKGASTCYPNVHLIDAVQYKHFNLLEDKMTPSTSCGKALFTEADKKEYADLQKELTTLGQDIANKIEEVYNQDKKISESLNSSIERFKKDFSTYKLTNAQIKKEISSSNIKEGMKTINDINGMLNDSDLRVLQANYNYILWSILAIGILTLTVHRM